MANSSKRTTDTHTTKKVTGSKSDEGAENTAAAGEANGSGGGEGGDPSLGGTRSLDPDFAGLEGEFGGAIARNEKDIQTSGQAQARGPLYKERDEPQEFIETGAGRVQSTKPVNEPAK